MTPEILSQAYIKRYGLSTRHAQSFKGKSVHIRTNGGLWRPNGYGYTFDPAQAWVIPFETGLHMIHGLGPEKKASLILCRTDPL